MRITRLELINYKCFEHLLLESLGSKVILVGPNGCGKSAILEAIATLKEFSATYNANENVYIRAIEIDNVHTAAWPSGIPLPIRAGCPFGTITADFSFEAEEEAIAKTDKATLSVKINQSGRVDSLTGVSMDLKSLLRYFDPESNIGVIDYITPHRTFPLQRLTTLNTAELSLDRQRIERIEFQKPGFDYKKFSSVKQYIVSQELESLSHYNATRIHTDLLAPLRKIFAEFFGPKTLIGYRNKNDELQIAIGTPYGTHDLDQLSSGEKELFSIIVNLFRIRKLPSIILYDEPERHLNAGLEARILPALVNMAPNNQLWIATHGLELIESSRLADIIALRREAGSSIPERFLDDSKTDRVRIFEAIGAKVGLQLAANRIVFLEGIDAHADKRILDKLAGPHLPGVVFVASGSSKGVLGAGTRAGLIIEKASRDVAFFMVLDRDFRDEASVGSLERRLENRAMVWPCHEVENLLLDDEAILDVLRNNGVESISNPEAVGEALLACARSQEELFIAQWAAYRLHGKINGEENENSFKPMNEDNVLKKAEGDLKRATACYAPETVKSLLAEAKTAIRIAYSNGTWRTILPGKEILREFQKRHLKKGNIDTFKEQIIAAMLRLSHMPPEVRTLCDRIKAL